MIPSGHRCLVATVGALLWMLTIGADPSTAARRPTWPGDFVARLEALALVETLNADLLSNQSATSTLERWCAVHQMASPARIVAVRMPDIDKPVTLQQRAELGVSSTEPVRYRHVRLVCGEHVLSEADNWYVPDRLSSEINRQLENTDIPFGKAVQTLHFQRRTLSSRVLWQPLPEGWEMNPTAAGEVAAPIALPHALLEHRALLILPDGTPISEVVESYTNEVLSFALPSMTTADPERSRSE
ncbi:MAG: hypothetical protein ABSF94_14885 [Steroidobacteraceae bacterium]